MKPKYLYIDDEEYSSLKSIINGFNDTNLIEVELYPLKRDEPFDHLKKNIVQAKPDGLIIDLRLDGEGPNRVGYTATSLAQEIRTLSAIGDFPSFPLVLCSTSPKMRNTYDADRTSHDLFDYKFEKSDSPEWEKFSRKLASLSEGYKYMNEKSLSIIEIFGRDEFEKIDSRIYERFSEQSFKAYDISQFVIKELFHHPGILIKERVLAARLGIDIEASGDNWDNLKDLFSQSNKYNGLYASGWERWWADMVQSQFKEIAGTRLTTLNAEERVQLLIQNTGLENLVPAKPIQYCSSTEFWTICEGHKKPLDPLEGFKVYESTDLKPWQEPKYLSFDAIVSHIGRIDLRPQASEQRRIDELKIKFS